MLSRSFDKYEGLGNDFIVVEADDEHALSAADAVRFCDRHFGVGADGVLLLLPARSAEAAARLRIINADGSVPEMCGNGVRCVALHVARARGLRQGTVCFETDAGLRPCTIDDREGRGQIVVDMGLVRVTGEHGVTVGTERLLPLLADAGNPHAILFGRFARADVERLGPVVATHSDFPQGTNVEFAAVASSGIDLVVWERGVGITLACGTGACATVAAACVRGLVPYGAPVAVRLPGGALEITVQSDGRATMRGPARHVFHGQSPTS